MIAQAMHDGMASIRVGVNTDGGSCLQYYGPAKSPSPCWWEMVPPPPECYPILLQVVFEHTVFDSVIPLKGSLCAYRGREEWTLECTLRDWNYFEISWVTQDIATDAGVCAKQPGKGERE